MPINLFRGMLEAFDGFIAAVNTETKIPFYKESDGHYIAEISFEEGRKQKVLIFVDTDDAGDSTINYYSKICKLQSSDLITFKTALELNVTLTYGAVALMDGSLVIHQTYFLKDMDPQRFMKSLLYVAAKADELEELFIHQDIS